jgi:G protein beta subunit-like protein
MVLQPLGQAPPMLPLDSLAYNSPYGVCPSHVNAPYTLMSNIRPSAKINAHNTFALKCHFTPDGLSVATTSADCSTKLWSATDYSLLNTFRVPSKKWVWDCAFTNDSKYMLTASSDALITMWDIKEEKIVLNYQGHSKSITAMCFRDTY